MIRKLAVDNFRYALLKRALESVGFDAGERKNVYLVRPSDIMKTQPVIDSCFIRRLFVWGDTPSLRWAANNTKLVRSGRKEGTDTGNYYYAKIEGKSRKTDPFMALAAGIGVAYLYIRERGSGLFETFGPFVIPMVSGYLIFVFTALNGKWAKELKSPYTYLIPDSAFRKLMNATAMQHVQSLVNACLITIPGGVVMGLAPMEILLCIVFYVVLSANKLYALAVAEVVVGDTLGTFGRQLFQLFIQGIAISAAVVGGVIGMAAGGVLQGYLLMDVFLSLFTFIFMVIAALNFYKIETA